MLFLIHKQNIFKPPQKSQSPQIFKYIFMNEKRHNPVFLKIHTSVTPESVVD